MENINSLLNAIYQDTLTQQDAAELTDLILSAKAVIRQARKAHWDEQDVVLITYADQFSEIGQPMLKTFTHFYNRWLKNTFSLVHLLPFYPYSSDDGFSVIDYHQVNPVAGDWQHIGELNQSTRLMFDYVCNHISAQSAWFQGYLAQQPEFDNHFIEMDPATDLHQVTRPRTSPLLTPFTLANGETRHIWTTFSADQIDLNFANPAVLKRMVNVLLSYLARGAEYVRLDAVGYMWKEPGTSCIHLEKTHQLVKLFRAIADVVAPGTVLITETNVPHRDNISYFGNGQDEAQMVYQFPLPPLVLHAIHCGEATTLSRWAAALDIPAPHCTFFNFLSSHDGIGLNPLRGLLPEDQILALAQAMEREGARVSYKNNPDGSASPYEINVTYLDALNHQKDSDALRVRRFMLAHAILLAFPGVPAIYIQSLLGSRNDNEGVERTGHNRAINRQKYALDEIEPQISGGNPLRSQIFSGLRRLIALRKKLAAFHPDAAMQVVELHPALLAFRRGEENNGDLLCLFNVSNKAVKVSLPENNLTDVISGEIFSSSQNFTVPPYGYYWLK
ncbi:alpha-amylase family glycosyl hydrolase [Nissabacter sp. SGAir0207]|uniref:alpha-amylase family glycosyl hydrolase n=1 Tax=Nissabacter sp. SGAir0207 TaxID=2126321 RepID=UPI0010CD61E0|nr:alpha-amylase family glycosyl hydrolase [Nissabacter sp. SGAir0207]QCR34760.1 sugar phosphorylase [Nissabacter sp. SGAir0207]